VHIASLSLTRVGPAGARHYARRGVLLLITSLCLLSQALASAADARDSVRAWRDEDAVIVQAQADLDAPLQTAWRVLTDYDHYAQFIPDLKSSRVLARSGNTAIVEQKGEAGFFLYHFPLEVTFSVTEVPDTAVRSRAISGTFKEMSGSYVLTEHSKGVRLVYNGRLVPAFRLPPFIGVPALRAAVERQFLALAREIRRVASAAEGNSDAR
jgi:ribosome-associated toxin RatA of RatAB toxin-antitoxin module